MKVNEDNITRLPESETFAKVNTNNIAVPKLKDYLNLELWAIRNNLYVHPSYLKAVAKKDKAIFRVSIIILAVVVLALILKIIFHMR